jgi:hypothetical protein
VRFTQGCNLTHTTQNVAVSAHVGQDSRSWGRTDGIGLPQYFVARERRMDPRRREIALFVSIEGGSRLSRGGRDGEEGIRLRCRDIGGLQSGIQSILWRKCNTRFVQRLKEPRVGSLMSCPGRGCHTFNSALVREQHHLRSHITRQ